MQSHVTKGNVDKLTLLLRYSPVMMTSIVDAAAVAIDGASAWYHMRPPQGCAVRLMMVLPDASGHPSAKFADLRFTKKTVGAGNLQGNVRIEWNPAKAGPAATPYIFNQLAAFLPETADELRSRAYVSRIDLAVDTSAIRCRHLVAQRTAHHKNAVVYVGADGHVSSIEVGARGSSKKTGSFLRVYDKRLPHHSDEMGVRAEIQMSRLGTLTSFSQIANPFARRTPRKT